LTSWPLPAGGTVSVANDAREAVLAELVGGPSVGGCFLPPTGTFGRVESLPSGSPRGQVSQTYLGRWFKGGVARVGEGDRGVGVAR
jgi:hypothetical protein